MSSVNDRRHRLGPVLDLYETGRYRRRFLAEGLCRSRSSPAEARDRLRRSGPAPAEDQERVVADDRSSHRAARNVVAPAIRDIGQSEATWSS